MYHGTYSSAYIHAPITLRLTRTALSKVWEKNKRTYHIYRHTMTLINTDCGQQHMYFAASKALTANSCGTYTHLVLLAVQFLPVTMLSVVPTSDADGIYTQSRTPDPNTRAREKSCSKLWNVARPIRSLSFSSAFRHALNYYYYVHMYVRTYVYRSFHIFHVIMKH